MCVYRCSGVLKFPERFKQKLKLKGERKSPINLSDIYLSSAAAQPAGSHTATSQPQHLHAGIMTDQPVPHSTDSLQSDNVRQPPKEIQIQPVQFLNPAYRGSTISGLGSISGESYGSQTFQMGPSSMSASAEIISDKGIKPLGFVNPVFGNPPQKVLRPAAGSGDLHGPAAYPSGNHGYVAMATPPRALSSTAGSRDSGLTSPQPIVMVTDTGQEIPGDIGSATGNNPAHLDPVSMTTLPGLQNLEPENNNKKVHFSESCGTSPGRSSASTSSVLADLTEARPSVRPYWQSDDDGTLGTSTDV